MLRAMTGVEYQLPLNEMYAYGIIEYFHIMRKEPPLGWQLKDVHLRTVKKKLVREKNSIFEMI